MASYSGPAREAAASSRSALQRIDATQAQLVRQLMNEQIRTFRRGGFDAAERMEFVCECARVACSQTLHLGLSEYETVRRLPTRFVLNPEHVNDDTERTVEKFENYVVVEKVGPAAEDAILGDPRKRRERERRDGS